MIRLYEKINKGEVYIIAEMSANHGGSIENALKIVQKAAEAGADCLKTQTYRADTITINCDNECFRIQEGLWAGYKLYDLYTDAYTPWEWQERIKQECKNCGIDFLSTPFDHTAVDFLESIQAEAYKISSFELVDIPLIEYAASKGKPMIISCGMGTIEEIQDAVEACHRMKNDKIVLLKCCSDYPANWEDMHLANILDMKQKFKVPIGLSDHSKGSLSAIVGTALGASVIEKHICLPDIKSADSDFSMSIEEFSQMIKNVQNTKKIVGTISYGPNKNEEKNIVFRRSLFATKNIYRGEVFSSENVRSIRPGQGMKPKYYSELLGKHALRDIKFGEPISEEMIKQ